MVRDWLIANPDVRIMAYRPPGPDGLWDLYAMLGRTLLPVCALPVVLVTIVVPRAGPFALHRLRPQDGLPRREIAGADRHCWRYLVQAINGLDDELTQTGRLIPRAAVLVRDEFRLHLAKRFPQRVGRPLDCETGPANVTQHGPCRCRAVAVPCASFFSREGTWHATLSTTTFVQSSVCLR